MLFLYVSADIQYDKSLINAMHLGYYGQAEPSYIYSATSIMDTGLVLKSKICIFRA